MKTKFQAHTYYKLISSRSTKRPTRSYLRNVTPSPTLASLVSNRRARKYDIGRVSARILLQARLYKVSMWPLTCCDAIMVAEAPAMSVERYGWKGWQR